MAASFEEQDPSKTNMEPSDRIEGANVVSVFSCPLLARKGTPCVRVEMLLVDDVETVEEMSTARNSTWPSALGEKM